MNNKLKRVLATVSAMTMLTAGMCTTGVTAFASEINGKSIIIDSEADITAINHSFSWSNIRSVTRLNEGFSLNTSKSVTIVFNNCSEGAAVVSLYKYGQSSAIRTVAMPQSYIPTQYVSLTLSAGSYYLTVVPQNGYEETSGSITFRNVDGITQTT